MRCKHLVIGLIFLLSNACQPSLTPQSYSKSTDNTGSDDGGNSSSDSFEEFLKSNSNIKFSKVTNSNSSGEHYTISLKQLIDHKDESKGYFEQQITLIHRGADRPMVLSTEGYNNFTQFYETELTRMYGANQIAVEYRYFGKSIPDKNYSHLNIWQGASDHHEVVQLFRKFYKGPWINTGASKSGMSSVFHRRFYPDDIDVSVPYVAPISFAAPDNRYSSFLNNAGTQDCKTRMQNFQIAALQKRTEVETLFKNYINGKFGNLFTGADDHRMVYEYVVADFAWGFWQYFGVNDCQNFPSSSSTAAQVFEFIKVYSMLDRIFDPAMANLGGAYQYQADRELGYPNQKGSISHIASYLQFYSMAAGPANGKYDPSVMKDIDSWVKSKGEKILFIYGGNDPWTAGAFDLGENSSLVKYTVPNGNHGAEINLLSSSDRTAALDKLDEWLGVKADRSITSDRYSLTAPREDLRRLRMDATLLELQRLRVK